MRISMLTILILLAFVPFSNAGDPNKLFDYQKTKLDNGLTVITLEDFSCPIVAVQIWYNVGSKNEDPNRQGFAHMFEHMMFRGTDRLGPEEHFSIIRSVGGNANGYTSFDRTVYLETMPSDQLDVALWLEAERMAFLKITQDYFDTERKVVEEELRSKLNEPYGTAWEKLFAGIFKVYPYRWTPIGQISHLRAASVKELREFWQKYYGPENAMLIIVGAVKHQDAQKLAEKYFGWIESGVKPQEISAKEPYIEKPAEIRIKGEKAPAPVAGIGWLTVPASSKDTVSLDLLSIILGSGESSRVYKEMVDQKRIAVGAEAGTYSLQQAGLFGAATVLPPMGSDSNEVIRLLEAQVAQLRAEPVSQKELDKAKNQMLRDTVTQNLEIENKAKAIGYATIDLGDTNAVNTIIDDIKKATAEDLQNVAKKYLDPNRVYHVYIEQNINGPVFSKNSNQEDANITTVKETEEPKPGRGNSVRPADYPQSAPLAKPNISSIKPTTFSKTLDNGLTVMVVPNKEVPFITVQLGITFGAIMDEIPGQCSMAMSLLDKGTKKYSATELAEALDSQAISLSASGGIDTSSIAVSCVSDRIENAMELMAEVVLNPTFPEIEFDKQKEKVLTNLAIQAQSPEYIADKQFRKQLYGNHPYSRTATGEVEDVNKLSAEICKKWWESFGQSNVATLIFAGDIDKDKAFALAEKKFKKWGPARMYELRVINNIPDHNEPTHIYLIDNPGSLQSQIRIGQLGITRKVQPEYFTSRIVSDYFGWGFNSRLNKSIRIEKGLTYGVYGGYTANNLAGEFVISTFSKTDSAVEAVKALLDEVKLLKTVPPTDAELAQSKSYIAGNFVINRETPQQVAQDLWLIKSQDLGDDYLDRLLHSVQNTTLEDCKNLVDKTINPDKMMIVVTGDAKVLKAPLEKIAPVTLVN